MFSQKKNKKLNYQSRFSKEENSAVKLKESLNTSWNGSRKSKTNSKKSNTLFFLVGVLLFLAALMYYLETKIK